MEERYIRNLGALTEQECAKLRTKTVFVAGCGGLGGYLIEMLLRLGVGAIRAADGDVFEASNLNRQLLSSTRNLGRSKAEAAQDRAAEVNPDVCFTAIPAFLTEENALELMVKAHQTHPECSLIYSQMYYVDPQLKIIAVSEHQRALLPGETFLTCHGIGVISHFVTFKKACYNKTEGMDESLRIAEDVDLYFKLEEVGETLFLPMPLYYYRIDTGCNVSLVDCNRAKTLGWEVLARAAACKRRGLPIEEHAFNILQKATEGMKDEARQQGAESIQNTKAYRIGKKITHLLAPFKRIK